MVHSLKWNQVSKVWCTYLKLLGATNLSMRRNSFKMGEEHEAMIVSIDKDERKMSLSIKKMTQDPWDEIESKFAVGSQHKGTVKNLTPYGVFVELESGIGGMIHISDLSWVKRFNHPSDFTKVGAELDVVVLGVDKETRKLSLGHKQIEEDPWNTFETVFPIGTVHDGVMIRKEEKGGIIQLQYGLEAFAPTRHLKKQDEKMVAVEETNQIHDIWNLIATKSVSWFRMLKYGNMK
jgi:small subunit ribosomal protein S1